MKSRAGADIVKAFTRMHKLLKDKGIKAKMHRLDNECPENIKSYMKSGGIIYQFVPPHIYHRNTV